MESEGECKVGLWQDKSKDLKDPRALEAKKTRRYSLNFGGYGAA